MIYLSDMPDKLTTATEKATWDCCRTYDDFERRYEARKNVKRSARIQVHFEEKCDDQEYRANFLVPADRIAFYPKDSAARNDIVCFEAYRNGIIDFWTLQKYVAMNNYLPVHLVRPEALEKYLYENGWRHNNNEKPKR